MMNPTMQNFPETMGRSVLAAFTRVLGWGWSHFMIAPKQNLGFGALGIAMVFSASNALFWQTNVHPAPLFATPKTVAMNIHDTGMVNPNIVPPHPLELAVGRAAELRDAVQNQTPLLATQPSVAPRENIEKVNNEMLARAQETLKSMGLFSGKVDGFYGPQTAEAIRAFEQKNALPVKGAMTVEIITSIINVSTTSRAPETVVPAPVASPLSPNINAISGRPASFNNGSQIPSASVILDDIIANIPQATVETSAPMPPVIAPIPPVGAAPAAVETAAVAPVSAPPLNPQIDAALIERIQFGLANLGFYNSSLDGIAGESTAKAIREFENFLSYPRTGNINEKVLLWLQEAGAFA